MRIPSLCLFCLFCSLSATGCDRRPAGEAARGPVPQASSTSTTVAPSTTAAAVAPDHRPKPSSVAILPAAGLAELPVGKSTRRDFEKHLGAPASVKQHGTYSTELRFPGGIHATFCQRDKSETIFHVGFQAPFAGHVDRGGQTITLGKTTAREARGILGKGEWRTSDESETWKLEYTEAGSRELSVHVQRDLSVPQYPLDEARHIDRPIIQIHVSVAHMDCDHRPSGAL